MKVCYKKLITLRLNSCLPVEKYKAQELQVFNL